MGRSAASCIDGRTTPHGDEVFDACRATGRSVAVVSNNSTVGVTRYLQAHELLDLVETVVGRTQPDPALLKPNSYLITEVLRSLAPPRPWPRVDPGDKTPLQAVVCRLDQPECPRTRPIPTDPDRPRVIQVTKHRPRRSFATWIKARAPDPGQDDPTRRAQTARPRSGA